MKFERELKLLRCAGLHMNLVFLFFERNEIKIDLINNVIT